MSAKEIDDYLEHLDQPQRRALENLRRTIVELVPEAEQGMAYGAPAFRVHGEVVAGFAAFKSHLSYLPHSGSVLGQLPDVLASYTTSKGALQFPVEKPLPKGLVKRLIDARLVEVGER